MVWGRVSVPKGKKLRFRIRIKLNKCQTASTSSPRPTWQIAGHHPVPLPAPGPGRQGQDPARQVSPGPLPGRRARSAGLHNPRGKPSIQWRWGSQRAARPSLTTVNSLDLLIGSLSKPYYVSYNGGSGDCSCCKDACGALMPATGTNTYFVPVAVCNCATRYTVQSCKFYENGRKRFEEWLKQANLDA